MKTKLENDPGVISTGLYTVELVANILNGTPLLFTDYKKPHRVLLAKDAAYLASEDKYDFIPLSIDEGYFISYKTGERTDVKVSDVVEEFNKKFLK